MMTDSLKPVRPKRLLRLVAAVAAAVVVYALYAAAPAVAREIVSYAIIQDDATLRVRGETVRLFGIFVPDQSRRCRTRIRPVRCGLNRAAEALDFKIQGFVRCKPVRRARDGSIEAFCSTGEGPRSEGVDLGEYLIERGLAVATPEAPFAYHVAEKIARANDRGVWGFQVDEITR